MLAIYQIKNTENEKIYVGSAGDTNQRWDIHKRCLRGNYHVNPHLQHAWNKYGEEAFEFSVVYEVDTVDELLPHEQWCLDVMLPEYNIAKDATAPMQGRKHSKATKEKMRKAATGRFPTDETKEKLSKSATGRKFSDETKRKLSEMRKGKLSGEKNPGSKLTKEQVNQMRVLRDTENITYKELGNLFGVHLETARRAILGKTW